MVLDLSSAFDTIDREFLKTRLEHSFGITDSALAWLQSYISERYQRVAVDSAMSTDCALKCGIPQWSMLSPILYYIYTKPIGDIIARHKMQYHCYADDTQIYTTVERDECIVAAQSKVEACAAEVADWKETYLDPSVLSVRLTCFIDTSLFARSRSIEHPTSGVFAAQQMRSPI